MVEEQRVVRDNTSCQVMLHAVQDFQDFRELVGGVWDNDLERTK